MDFRFTADEQHLLAQAAQTFRRWLPPERLLNEDGPADGWHKVADDGWLQLAAEMDDDQVSLALICGVAREAGRVLAGDGFVNNAILLARAAEPVPPAFVLADGRNPTVAGGPAETVPWCFGAEPGLVAAHVDSHGNVSCTGAGDWTLSRVPDLALGVGTVTPGALEPRTSLAVSADLGTSARVVHAASLVGLGEQVLADATEHARNRHQFATPIGRFQAVKHPLADAAVALEVAWNAALYASLRLDETTATIAALQAKRAVDTATRTAAQTFGGVGMTFEHHLHLYLKVARSARYRFGDPVQDAVALADSVRHPVSEGASR